VHVASKPATLVSCKRIRESGWKAGLLCFCSPEVGLWESWQQSSMYHNFQGGTLLLISTSWAAECLLTAGVVLFMDLFALFKWRSWWELRH
jgi:hypothetical protein